MAAKRNPRRADLVLSGGGVKGIGLVGAVGALRDAGYGIERISGTSAGALVGAVVAAFTREFEHPMPVFEALTSHRDPGTIETRFAAYLGEIEALAALADTGGAAVR